MHAFSSQPSAISFQQKKANKDRMERYSEIAIRYSLTAAC